MKDRFNNAVGPQVRARKTGPGRVVPALAALSLGGGLQTATAWTRMTVGLDGNRHRDEAAATRVHAVVVTVR